MHLDSHGLPVQSNGDPNDQLQRCGMVVVGADLEGNVYAVPLDTVFDCKHAVEELLQPKPGTYVRYVGGDPNTVSADQLIGALAAHVSLKNTKQVGRMFLAMCRRLGFAQNTKDGLDASNTKTKLPDFMLLRALPLFARAHWLLYPAALLADLLLIALALSAVGPVFPDGAILPRRRGPDDVDDNNTVLTLAVCRSRMCTPLGLLACKIYGALRPWNLGCSETTFSQRGDLTVANINSHAYHPVYGALRHYHREEAGGNPEVAELWKPICKRYFE